MSDDERRIRIRGDCGAVMAPIWIMGWLFTIGFLALPFWKAVLAIIIWPYYLGVFFR